MSNVKTDVKAMLGAGVHFGHKASRRHPKMAPYIHSKQGDGHIIDLIQTDAKLHEALDAVVKTVAEGKTVLFVGTKRQAREAVQKAAEKTGMPFVNERWLGGMLTNSKTMSSRIKHLLDTEAKMESGELNDRFNKLEVQRFQEEIDRLNKVFSGVKNHPLKPGIVFVTDAIVDNNAVKEAVKLNVPVVAICDTNADPTTIDYPVPANDDAVKSIQLITDYIVEAVQEGKTKAKAAPAKKEAEDKKAEK